MPKHLIKYMRKMITHIKSGVRRRINKIIQKSETSKCRLSLSKYCTGDGLDIGFGGDPIVPGAICLDLPKAYAKYLKNPQHLHGDAKNLFWFKDSTLDYVFSSHVLEDFEDTSLVLDEWLRVIKKGGNLVLFLPEEKEYREYCKLRSKLPNQHHIHEYFGLEYLKDILKDKENLKIIHEQIPVGIYSFEIVVQKQ